MIGNAKGGGRGRRGSPPRDRSRTPPRDRRGGRSPPRGAPPKRDGGSKDPSLASPAANAAFQLAKSENQCGHLQKGQCSYGSKCQIPHVCVLCGKKNDHGAMQCSKWNSAEAKRILGV